MNDIAGLSDLEYAILDNEERAFVRRNGYIFLYRYYNSLNNIDELGRIYKSVARKLKWVK
jgi:hypothetical protein